MNEGGVEASLVSVGVQWPLSSRISNLKSEKCGPAHLRVPQRCAELRFSFPEPVSSAAGGLGPCDLWLVSPSTLHLNGTHICWAAQSFVATVSNVKHQVLTCPPAFPLLLKKAEEKGSTYLL